jgi:hypothetical protein
VTTVQLPDGCSGLDMANGVKYTADRPGGHVEVTSADATYLNRSWYGQNGVMTGSAQFSFGTRRTRWCAPCRRAWNAWSDLCPRCGEATQPAEEN